LPKLLLIHVEQQIGISGHFSYCLFEVWVFQPAEIGPKESICDREGQVLIIVIEGGFSSTLAAFWSFLAVHYYIV